jgi:tetratricopeptide (TPR) repeat protein
MKCLNGRDPDGYICSVICLKELCFVYIIDFFLVESEELGISYDTPKMYHSHDDTPVPEMDWTTESEEEDVEGIDRNDQPYQRTIFNTSTLATTGAPPLDQLLSLMCSYEARSSTKELDHGKNVHGKFGLENNAAIEVHMKSRKIGCRQKVNMLSKFILPNRISAYISPFPIRGVDRPTGITRFPRSLWPYDEQHDYWVEEKFMSQDMLLELNSKGSPIGKIIPVVRRLANALGELNYSMEQSFALYHALKLTLRLHGKDHRDTIIAWYEMAKHFSDDVPGEIESTQKVFIERLQPFAKTLKESDPLFIKIMELGTRILRAKKEYKSAEFGQRQLIRIALSSPKVTMRFLLQLLEELGDTLHTKGSYVESQEVKLTLINLQHSGKFDVTLTEIIAAQASLAKTYRAQGKFRQSICMLRSSLACWKEKIAADSEDIVPARTELANTLRVVGRWEEALKVEQPLMENKDKFFQCIKYPTRLERLLDYAQDKYSWGDYKRAVHLYLRALEEFRCADRVTLGCDVSYIYDRIGWAYWMMDNLEQSKLFFAKAKEAWDMVEPRVRQHADY